MGLTEAFRKFGAELKNTYWSVSAENEKGELVVSLWKQYFGKPVNGRITYSDKASRWSGNGNTEFRERIRKAYELKQVVRAIVARANNEEAVANGEDASNLKNTFDPKVSWEGKVTLWDGDGFEIEFNDSARRV